jgi:hypothetical protein
VEDGTFRDARSVYHRAVPPVSNKAIKVNLPFYFSDS